MTPPPSRFGFQNAWQLLLYTYETPCRMKIIAVNVARYIWHEISPYYEIRIDNHYVCHT